MKTTWLFTIYVGLISGISIYFWLKHALSRKTSFNRIPNNGAPWLDFGLVAIGLFLFTFGVQRILAHSLGIFTSLSLEEGTGFWIVALAYPFIQLLYFVLGWPFINRLLSLPINNLESTLLAAIKNGVRYCFTYLPYIWMATIANLGLINTLHSFGIDITAAPQPLVAAFASSQTLWFKLAVLICAVIIAPIAEELVFRATLYRFLKSKMTAHIAMMLSSLIFGLAHGHLAAVLPLAVLAGFLVRTYENTGHLAGPITLHACFNLNTIVMLLLMPPQLLP